MAKKIVLTVLFFSLVFPLVTVATSMLGGEGLSESKLLNSLIAGGMTGLVYSLIAALLTRLNLKKYGLSLHDYDWNNNQTKFLPSSLTKAKFPIHVFKNKGYEVLSEDDESIVLKS